MSKDLLFEIGLEELPSGEVLALGKSLQENFQNILQKHDIKYQEIKFFATPRRLAVIVVNLGETKPGSIVEKRGPKVEGNDLNSKPVQGFANSLNIDVSQLTTVKTDKGEWWNFKLELQPVAVTDLIEDIVLEAVEKLPVKKPMSWGEGDSEFVRPVHWAVVLFGDEVKKVNLLGVEGGNVTYGHRFLHNKPVTIAKASDYEELLQESYVIADFNKRRDFIAKKIKEVCAEKNLQPIIPSHLLTEVTSIVEWPVPMLASFDPKFLNVPALALRAAMEGHQKCFPVTNNAGELKPYFVTVANIETDDLERIVKGNESVMRARLSDAEFFYTVDQKNSLDIFNKYLSKVIFQAKLGTLQDKVDRLQLLMAHMLVPFNLDEKLASRAVELSKCDLMTGMVGEFPELQGYMGQEYARIHGEDETVAAALFEQYLPRFAEDDLPKTPLGTALSLIDRIDTLVGIFAISQKPTGMKDPFKLRRHALAVVKLLIQNDVKIEMSQFINTAYKGFAENSNLPKNSLENVAELKSFILDRLDAYYAPLKIKSDFIDAVKEKQSDWLYDMHQRLLALQKFMTTTEAYSLAQASKRVNNILEKNANTIVREEVNLDLLTLSQEKELLQTIVKVEEEILPLYVTNSYDSILKKLAQLKEVVDNFFDNVMVLCDDLQVRENRLILLKKLQSILTGVADISKLSL